jgi:hypothetical protein
VSYYDATHVDLKYATTAIGLRSPGGGDTWPVGAKRTVAWDGAGTVDIALSLDGGTTWEVLAEGVSGGRHGVVVPHTPSRFCRLRVERTIADNMTRGYYYPASIAQTDSFLTIETSVSLLNLLVTTSLGQPGAVVSWNTDPGPADLEGYRLERRRGNEAWVTLTERTTDTRYHDIDAQPGDTYRLFARNGSGEDLLLGESSGGRVPGADGRLLAYPVPFRSGELQIRVGVESVGGVAQPTEVVIYDVAGRRVRTIADVASPGGSIFSASWDGRDDRGRQVASGVYFIRARSGRSQQTRKLVIVR